MTISPSDENETKNAHAGVPTVEGRESTSVDPRPTGGADFIKAFSRDGETVYAGHLKCPGCALAGSTPAPGIYFDALTVGAGGGKGRRYYLRAGREVRLIRAVDSDGVEPAHLQGSNPCPAPFILKCSRTAPILPGQKGVVPSIDHCQSSLCPPIVVLTDKLTKRTQKRDFPGKLDSGSIFGEGQ